MIRVIQMVLAEVLKRNNPKSPLIEIIQLFKQGNEHLFSIDNICQHGQIHQRCTGSNEILSIICSMLTNQLQNQACRSIGPTIKPTLNCRILPEIYYSTLEIKNIESESSFSFPRFIIISNRIQNNSDGTIPIYYIDHMKHLMKLKYFCGLVGGISNQALYIVGYHQEKAIILDPHYIQDEGEQETELKYFQQTPRGIPFNKLKNSFSFCFLIENVHEYHEWASQLCYCHQIYSPYLAFEVQSDDPNYIIQKYRKKSEDYEYL